jgi:hypothetical protein
VPLALGQALSYSPLLYRPRERWPDIYAALVGETVQPASAENETAAFLDAAFNRVDAAFRAAAARFEAAALDAVVVLVADRGRLFDASNTPQLHVMVGDEIRGDRSCAELGEAPEPHNLRCDAALAGFLAEELAADSFDVAETRGALRPLGDPQRSAGPALTAPLLRLGITAPIVPIHVNCHVSPAISGRRMPAFGAALARVLALVPKRVGVLASGGLSGQPGEAMAGWIDDVLDAWILARFRTRRSADTARIFDVESQTMRGQTQEVRLWTAAGSACEAASLRPTIDDYLSLHHAAAGIGFAHWSAA